MDMLNIIKHTLTHECHNPILKHFDLGKQIGTYGPELTWKIFQATRIDDGKEASVFIFEKKSAEKLYKSSKKEMVWEVMRRDVDMICTLRHPSVLRLLRPLEECHDSLAFASEPVLGSLSNFLGQTENKTPPFLELELKCGLMQICQVLSYMHTHQHMVHTYITPNNILITRRRMWRVAGFSFVQPALDTQIKDTYKVPSINSKTSKITQADMDFTAPEVQLNNKTTTSACDIFSLGMLICSLYNGGKSLIQANHNSSLYSKQVQQLPEMFSDTSLKLPVSLVEATEKMINIDLRYRPTPQLFMLLKYFDDPVLKVLQALEHLEPCKDPPHDLFPRVALIIPLCPRLLLHSTILPAMKEQMVKPEMLCQTLNCLIVMLETSNEDDVMNVVVPELSKAINMTNRPVQATVFLLEKIEVMLRRCDGEMTKHQLLPLVFNAIESNSIPAQEAAMNVFKSIQEHVDEQTTRKLLLPSAKSLFHKTTSLRTKLNALACIERLLVSLDRMTILDEVLPFLTDVTSSDVDVVMCITGIYKHLLSDSKYGLNHNLIATKVMPTLVPFTVCPGMKLNQFNELMGVLTEMLRIIEEQRRNKMISETPDAACFEMRKHSMDMRFSNSLLPHHKSQSNFLNPLDDNNRFRASSVPGSSKELQGSANSINTSNTTHTLKTPLSFLTRRHSSFQALMSSSTNNSSLDSQLNKNSLGGVLRQFSLSKSPAASCSYKASTSVPPATSSKGINYKTAAFKASTSSLKAPSPHLFRGQSSKYPSPTPSIMVSKPSISDLRQPSQSEELLANDRRASTHSVGVIEPLRKNSRELLDKFNLPSRRPSFHGVCKSAMHFFSK